MRSKPEQHRKTRIAEAIKAGLLGSLCAFSATGWQAQAGTDDAEPQATEQPQETPRTGVTELNRLMVTAQKRVEPMSEVPISMSVIEADCMAEGGEVKFTDYFNKVPGLSINSNGAGRTSVLLRGITTGASTLLVPTVGFTVDDVPFGSSIASYVFPDLDPADLSHIEVLRGPQGTLYGASSMGGLIKFVTADPDTQAFEGRVQADFSSVAHGGTGYGMRAMLNLPIAQDRFALRLSAFFREDPGYIKDTLQHRSEVNRGNAQGARVSALWQASENVTVKAAVLAQDGRYGATGNVDFLGNTRVPAYGEYTHERMPGTDGSDIEVRLYNLSIDADLGWANLISLSGYGDYSLEGPYDFTNSHGVYAASLFDPAAGLLGARHATRIASEKFTQELRLSSPFDDRRVGWNLGGFYTQEDYEYTQRMTAVDPVTGQPGAGHGLVYQARQPSEFTEMAAFGDLTFRFTERFDAQAGVRFSKNRQFTQEIADGPMNGGPSQRSSRTEDEVFTYLLSTRFRPSEHLMLYARIASGYRAGGPNQFLLPQEIAAGLPASFSSDSLVNYELGLKGDFFDRKLDLAATLFYIDWADVQMRERSALGTSYYTNGGTAKSEGLEATLNFRPVAGLTFTLSGAYTNAVLTQDAGFGTHALAGDRLPFSPRVAGNLSARYEFPLSDALEGFVGGGVNYMGDTIGAFNSSASTPRYALPSYTTLDLNLGLRGESWTLNLYAKNLTDELGYLSATARNWTTGLRTTSLELIRPRTIGASITYHF